MHRTNHSEVGGGFMVRLIQEQLRVTAEKNQEDRRITNNTLDQQVGAEKNT